MKKRKLALLAAVFAVSLAGCGSIEEMVTNPEAMLQEAENMGTQMQNAIENNEVPEIPTIPEEVTQVVQEGLKMVTEHISFGGQSINVSVNNDNGWDVKVEDGLVKIFSGEGDATDPLASLNMIDKAEYEKLLGDLTKDLDYEAVDGVVKLDIDGAPAYLKMINDQVGYYVKAADEAELDDIIERVQLEVEGQ